MLLHIEAYLLALFSTLPQGLSLDLAVGVCLGDVTGHTKQHRAGAT